jgi:hypothetical protein
MPIDPNIAMGVRPIEQPNMLGQMAQIMAMRQAQQEYEGSQGVNELARRGVKDPNEYLQHGAVGRKTYESILKGQKDLREGQKLEIDLGITKIGAFRDQLMANVNDPAAAAKWLTAVNSDPLVGKVLSSVPLEDQIAGIPTDPKGFADWKNRTALKAPDFVKHFVESADAKLAAGTAANRLNFDKLKDTREQDQLKAVLGIVSPERTSSATAIPINMGGSGAVVPVTPPAGGTQMPPAGAAPVIPPTGAQTPATGTVGKPNVLATQVAPPQTSVPVPTTVNNLGQGSQKDQLVDQISQLARIPTTAASRALEMKVKEFNVLYPTEKIEQDRQGNLITIVNGVAKPVVGMTGLPVQGKPLPETAFESTVGRKTGEDVVAFVNRAQAAPKNIAKIDEALGILKTGGAVTGFGAENRLNLERAMSLFGNDVKAGKRVVDTQILDALLGSDVFPSLQSMGLGSKNIDTPAEREFIRQVITGTIQLDNDALIRLTQIRRNVETNAIKEYNQKLESGKFNKYSKAADQKLEKIEVPNPIIRKGTHKNGRSVIEYADGTVEYGN